MKGNLTYKSTLYDKYRRRLVVNPYTKKAYYTGYSQQVLNIWDRNRSRALQKRSAAKKLLAAGLAPELVSNIVQYI